MPVISMFYGLIIAMYYLDTKTHKLPHIYVKYGEKEGVYEIPNGIYWKALYLLIKKNW